MNPIDDQLKRLFQAAAQARHEAGAPPYGLEACVMAEWRRAQSAEGMFWDMTLLVRGLILASVIMLLSFWPALHTSSNANPFADFLQLADSTVPSDDSP